MSSDGNPQNAEAGAAITLGLLEAVHENAEITQRSVSKRLGIALGLTNAYLRRCVKKGLIKIQQVPRKRYAYYLTPQGFAEKSRLTTEYFSSSLSFFRKARREVENLLRECAQRGHMRIALFGAGDLAEIALLCAREVDVEIVCIIDSGYGGSRLGGVPVLKSIAQASGFDAVLVTSVFNTQADFEVLRAHFPEGRLFFPSIAGIVAQAQQFRKSTL